MCRRTACPLEEGLLEKTLIIFSSDNGPVLNDGYKDGAPELAGDHLPAGGLRGGKYSLFDGGTHIPLFVYWKGKIQPVVSDALVCQVDILASLGSICRKVWIVGTIWMLSSEKSRLPARM